MRESESPVKQSLIELSFFVPHTKARATRLARMASELRLDSPEGGPVLSAGFLPSRGEPFFLFVDVDEFVDEDRTKDFFVQLSFHPKPETKPPKALRDRPQ